MQVSSSEIIYERVIFQQELWSEITYPIKNNTAKFKQTSMQHYQQLIEVLHIKTGFNRLIIS